MPVLGNYQGIDICVASPVMSCILWLISRTAEAGLKRQVRLRKVGGEGSPMPGAGQWGASSGWGFSPGQCRPYRYWALPRVLGTYFHLSLAVGFPFPQWLDIHCVPQAWGRRWSWASPPSTGPLPQPSAGGPPQGTAAFGPGCTRHTR